MSFKFEIGQKVRLRVPEFMYNKDKTVSGVILDRRVNTEYKRRHYNDYLVSHTYDANGEWRSESLISAE
jgi:hypothetical protein